MTERLWKIWDGSPSFADVLAFDLLCVALVFVIGCAASWWGFYKPPRDSGKPAGENADFSAPPPERSDATAK